MLSRTYLIKFYFEICFFILVKFRFSFRQWHILSTTYVMVSLFTCSFHSDNNLQMSVKEWSRINIRRNLLLKSSQDLIKYRLVDHHFPAQSINPVTAAFKVVSFSHLNKVAIFSVSSIQISADLDLPLPLNSLKFVTVGWIKRWLPVSGWLTKHTN